MVVVGFVTCVSDKLEADMLLVRVVVALLMGLMGLSVGLILVVLMGVLVVVAWSNELMVGVGLVRLVMALATVIAWVVLVSFR